MSGGLRNAGGWPAEKAVARFPVVDRGVQSGADAGCRGQLKLQARFGRQCEVLFASSRYRRTGHATDRGANRRAFAAARNPPDDGAESGATADLAGGLLALTLALAFDVRGGHLVHHAAKADGVELQRDLVTTLHLARLLDLDRLQHGRVVAGDPDPT